MENLEDPGHCAPHGKDTSAEWVEHVPPAGGRHDDGGADQHCQAGQIEESYGL